MLHTVLIGLHAAAGTVALLAGCVAIARGVLFGTYLWSLVGMEIFLVSATAAEWSTLDPGTKALFVTFAGLGLFMLWLADQARRIRPAGSARPDGRYVAHIGFTLVALFDAFVVIAVLDAGAPIWLVVAAGVGVAVIGHYVLRAAKQRIVGTAAARAGSPSPIA